ncbi:MAG: heme lyase CcmF/NrfE family subunit [Anaerolineaceae bacterium]|nr:MAG: heme lyase CcmF/NrfE family subunit [Anaerolineaceae bacterium]
MLAEFGYGVLVVTFLLALYSVGAAIFGYVNKSAALVESARRSMLLTFPLLTVAALSLILLLVRGDFNVQFVYEVTSRSMPTYLKITAWWGGQAGSLLFWSWLMSAFASAATLRKWDRDQEFLPWVIVVANVTLAFFLALNILFENPFARLYQTFDGNIAAYTFAPANSTPITPADGRGLNPLLRHPGMIIHPPMLYLGFVAYVIPFAFAIAALVTGRTDDRWIRVTRRWSLWAWLFLSFGLVLGGRWAYDVLGWGGYWGWDPVEIAAFMPWLTGTAFLHSVMIQEKRGMLKQWNMVLIILTYALVIFGTFLTRSGVLSSVHAFAQSAIGPSFFVFIGVTFVTSIGLLIHRWADLKAEAEMKSMLSREALFLLNNLLFMSVLVVSFWGVIFPLISELFTGQKVTVGPPFYERANSPLFAALMFLMAIAPLSAWGHSTVQTLGRAIWKPAIAAAAITVVTFFTYTQNWIALIGFFLVALVVLVTLYEFWRGARARQKTQGENFFSALAHLTGKNRRRYGGYIIHISMMLMAIGILGIELFQTETQGTIQVGESLRLQGYELVYRDIAQWDDRSTNVNYTRAVMEVYKNDQLVTKLHPRTDYYYEAQQNMTIPGVRSTMADDVYVLLVDWEPASAIGATFKLYINPLVNWLWVGSLLFLVGVIIAAWPEKDPERATVRATRSARQTSAAD